MSPFVVLATSRCLRTFRRVLPVLALLAELGMMPACASTQLGRARAPSMHLDLDAVAHHRLLTGMMPAALGQGPKNVTAHVFTQPGSLVSVFAKVLPSPSPDSFALDVRIPEPLMHQPLLVRVSGAAGFYQVLVMPAGGAGSPLVAHTINDTTTVVAQAYVAARAAQSWPLGSDPQILNTIISPELALAVRAAANPERTLAAVTQGLVAAVCAWQAVLRHDGLTQSAPEDGATLVASLNWRTDAALSADGAVHSALVEARARARCVDCTVPAAHLALAAQAGADAWLIYADKLPWSLRSQALVDASALQAHFATAMVAEVQSGVPNAATQTAALALDADLAQARQSASKNSPTATARGLRLAWQRYAQAVWQGIDGDDAARSAIWDASRASLQSPISALRQARQGLNSRVAPAQAAASMAERYMQIFVAAQACVHPAAQNMTPARAMRLSAVLTLRSGLLSMAP